METHPALGEPQSDRCETGPWRAVVVISSDSLGRGDDELGQILLRNYLHTLRDTGSDSDAARPGALIFLNNGVKLVVEGAPTLDDLRALADQGVQVLSCGTCLGHFGLKESVAVGEITNMYAIADAMLRADKVINL